MGKLSDILAAGGTGENAFLRDWNQTVPVTADSPLPAGVYSAHATKGELSTSRNGNPRYSLEFTVCDAPYSGRRVWLDVYLTAAALPRAKRNLAKLGITEPAQLEAPLPMGIRCEVAVTLRVGDDGRQRNSVTRFDVLGIDSPGIVAPAADPFAPTAAEPGQPAEGGGDDLPF